MTLDIINHLKIHKFPEKVTNNIIAVWCQNQNGVIGVKEKNCQYCEFWDDRAFFKQLTTGGVVIMGRNTFASLGFKPLKDRINIVISHNKDLKQQFGVHVTDSIEKAIITAAILSTNKPIFIIGGGEIYRQSLPYCTDVVYMCLNDGGNDAQFESSDLVYAPKMSPEWVDISDTGYRYHTSHGARIYGKSMMDIGTNEYSFVLKHFINTSPVKLHI